MTLRRTTKKRRPPRTSPAGVDVVRVARNAITLVERSLALLDHPVSRGIPQAELNELKAAYPLPPSYESIASRAVFSGPSGEILPTQAIRSAIRALQEHGIDTERFFPFGQGDDKTLCFDTRIAGDRGELGVVAIVGNATEFVAASFGEWLDDMVVALESFVRASSDIPQSLRRLLVDLGFTFEHSLRAVLETQDADALLSLLARRFEQSGYLPHMTAKIVLHVATMRIECTVGERVFRLPTEDTFRWLRGFRDEDFFGSAGSRDSKTRMIVAKADRARDLRVIERISVRRSAAPKATPFAQQHTFISATANEDGLFFLARPTRAGAAILLRGTMSSVEEEIQLPGPARALATSQDGALWVLLEEDLVLRLHEGKRETISLPFPKPGAPWAGLATTTSHAFIWGAQGVLFTADDGIAPVELAPPLGTGEEIRDVAGARRRLTILRQGKDAAYIADFRSGRWKTSVAIELRDLVAFDGTHDDALVLSRSGHLLHITEKTAERVRWNRNAEEALDEGGFQRVLHSVLGFGQDIFFATDGGTLRLEPSGSVTYLRTGASDERASLHRAVLRGESMLLEVCGPFVGFWNGNFFEAIDASAF